MSFDFVNGALRCKSCTVEVNLDQYRRKSSYCDDCEVERLCPEEWIDRFQDDLEDWTQTR